MEGKKTWNDKDNQDGKRPAEITINLLKNGTKINSVKVKEADGWKWKFEGLDKYENGKEITYSITEEQVDGYSVEINGYDVKNSYTPGKTSVQVTKVWEDKNDQDGVRPNSVTIKLLADGKETGKTLTLTKADNWTGTFTDLDEYKEGKKIVYTVEEVKVKDYETVITGDQEKGFTITNIRIKPWTPMIPPTRNIKVTKDWKLLTAEK
ncbi:Cna B-type domain-containing protein, partial [Helcococcus ovis]